jgi:hypothetical protein
VNSTEAFRNYKHDIVGKFKDVSTAINSLSESSFDDSDNNEIFHAIHEVILKMVKTSRNTILEKLNQELVLIISDQTPDTSFSKLQIEGAVVRYEIKKDVMNYYLYSQENTPEIPLLVAKLVALLPIKNIIRELN